MTTAYTLLGSGPEHVLVMHGWLGDHTVFAPMFPALDLSRFSYAFPDYRGYGKSRQLSGRYDMEELATDALALADQLGWERFHLVGHSMGGMAIQKIMVKAPARVKSAVAVAPVPASGTRLDEEGRGLFEGAVDSDEHRRIIIDFTTGNRLSGVWLDKMVRDCREATTRDAFAGYLKAFTDSDFSAEVKGLEAPLLVLPGEHDPALSSEIMRTTFLEWYPRASMEVLPNAGHYPMQETPVYLATVIERFLAEHAGGR